MGRPHSPDGPKMQHGCRLTPALTVMVKAAAASNRRSVAKEIEYRIAQSFDQDRMRTVIREELRAILGQGE